MSNFLSRITHSPVVLTQGEKEYIEDFVMGSNFPWYWQGCQTLDNVPEVDKNFNFYNGPYLSHTLLTRAEDPKLSHLDRPANHFSRSYEIFAEIFHRFMINNSLTYSKIYRANLNLNWHNGETHTKPHKDHTFPHNNFIMYLNTCERGHTIIWPDDFSSTASIPCEQYTAVTFKELWHAHHYPPPGSKRVVFVVTYI